MVFPYQFAYVLTDNGPEFMKHFDDELRRLHLIHYHTYPRTPKMNAHCERFNHTLQEEFVDYHAGELLDPIAIRSIGKVQYEVDGYKGLTGMRGGVY